MTAVATVGRRYLPRGWADFGRQLSIWFGFLIAYQFVRGLADRNPSKAFDNGWRVLGVEQGMTHHIFELTLQRVAESSSFLNRLTSLTYWTSEFAVVGIALLYVYLRRHDSFSRFRNWILLANVLGLVGYLLGNNWPLLSAVVKAVGYGGLALVVLAGLTLLLLRRRELRRGQRPPPPGRGGDPARR